MVHSAYPEDDMRMLKRLQPRFLGRAVYPFEYGEDTEEEEASRAKSFVEQVHQILPDAVVQGVFSETIFPCIDDIAIPSWVFEVLGLPVESRQFRYVDMFGSDFAEAYDWSRFGAGGTVLDLTRSESQLWWLYRMHSFLAVGCEAIHLGQPHLYARKDRGYGILSELIAFLRESAKDLCQRGAFLLDAHSHGLSVNGASLIDFQSRALSALPDEQHPEDLILQLKGGNLYPERPFLIEIDNWGGRQLSEEEWRHPDLRRATGRWGWDDISWFAHQSDADRAHFLNYALMDLKVRHPQAYLQLPLHRTLGNLRIKRGMVYTERYHANRPSQACPVGWGDEEQLLYLWDELAPAIPDGGDLSQLEPPTVRTGEGIDLSLPVTLVGELQRVLGGRPGDTWCPHSRMFHQGQGRFIRRFVVPRAGNYAFRIAVGGTMTDVFDAQGLSAADEASVHTKQDLRLIEVEFDYDRGRIRIQDISPVV